MSAGVVPDGAGVPGADGVTTGCASLPAVGDVFVVLPAGAGPAAAGASSDDEALLSSSSPPAVVESSAVAVSSAGAAFLAQPTESIRKRAPRAKDRFRITATRAHGVPSPTPAPTAPGVVGNGRIAWMDPVWWHS
jgi:hypothetical protein